MNKIRSLLLVSVVLALSLPAWAQVAGGEPAKMDEPAQIRLPAPVLARPAEKASAAEEIVFDKAEQAEKMDNEKNDLKSDIQRLEDELKEAPDRLKEEVRKTLEKHRSGPAPYISNLKKRWNFIDFLFPVPLPSTCGVPSMSIPGDAYASKP